MNQQVHDNVAQGSFQKDTHDEQAIAAARIDDAQSSVQPN